MDSSHISLETKVDRLADQVQRVSLGLAQQSELLSGISNTPPKKKGRASTGTPQGTPKKKEPHPLELVDTDEIDYLKTPGHIHLRVVMGRSTATAPLPPPPNDAEKRRITTAMPTVSAYPSDSAPLLIPVNHHLASQGVISQDFAEYLRTCLSRVGLTRFTYDWEGRFEDQFNQFALQFFLRTFKQAISSTEYGVPLRQPVDNFDLKLTSFFYVHTQTLKAQYKAQIKNPNILNVRKEAGRVRKSKQDRCKEYAKYLSAMAFDPKIVNIFFDHHVMGEETIVIEGPVTHRQISIPTWWSDKFLKFIVELERRVQISILADKLKGPRRTLRQFIPSTSSTIETSNVPQNLPQDCYSKSRFLDCLLPVQLKAWNLQPPVFSADVMDRFGLRTNQQAHSEGLEEPSSKSKDPPSVSILTPICTDEDPSEFPEGMFENEKDDGNGLDDDEMMQ